MNPYILEMKHQETHPNSHFFDPATLRFFGERKSDMRVLKDVVQIKDYSGKPHACYVLSTLQRACPTGPKRVYHYFDTHTFDEVHGG